MFELVVSQRQHEFKLRLPVVALGDVEQLALASRRGADYVWGAQRDWLRLQACAETTDALAC